MAEVLVIDDDTIMREMIVKMIEKDGISTISAENGNVALRLLETEQVNLVVTDIVMPEKEGLETIMCLKKQQPDLPIIAVSGGGRNNPELYLNIAQTLGAKFTFIKPFDRESFLIAVRHCLHRNPE